MLEICIFQFVNLGYQNFDVQQMIHSKTCFHLSSTKSKAIHILWVPHMKVVKLQVHLIFYKYSWQNIFIQWTTTPRIEPSRFKTIYSKKLTSLGLKKWRNGMSVKCCHTCHHVKYLWTWTLQSHHHVKAFEVWVYINFSMLWTLKALYITLQMIKGSQQNQTFSHHIYVHSLQLIIKNPFLSTHELTLNWKISLCINTLIKSVTFNALENNM